MKPCTLLAVDDEIENIESIKRALRREARLTILGTTHPQEALEIFQTEKIHILITDQRMPELSGTELLREVVSISPDTVRIILTAYTDVQEILDAINMGHVYSYIIKPWNPEEVRTVVQQARLFYRLRDENRLLTEELKQKNQLIANIITVVFLHKRLQNKHHFHIQKPLPFQFTTLHLIQTLI